jgi:aspartate-semialdehyde dehydrogenase
MDAQRLRKSPNIAVVGSTSLLGKELREMLEDRAFPIGKLALLETEEYAGLLQEFAGDLQITQVIAPDAFEDIDIAFFTCSPEIMHSYIASGAKFPELTIDLTQAGLEGTVYLHGISDPKLLRSQGYFVNPHPAAIVLARILSRLHTRSLVHAAGVTVLEPASERGTAGTEELQEQTVNLLNFQQIENKIFESQLAFNVLPEPKTAQQTEKRILEHLVGILGKTFPRPMITVLQAPVFHSYAFSLFVQFIGSHITADISGELSAIGHSVVVHSPTESPSPVGVVGSDKIHIGRLRMNAEHGNECSMWIVADNLRVAAANAIQRAEHIMLTPAVDA